MGEQENFRLSPWPVGRKCKNKTAAAARTFREHGVPGGECRIIRKSLNMNISRVLAYNQITVL
ncbi:MAG: hypothetical protein IJ283_05745 [Oscillospiraceae bacterium]|nr:hypothetical protein [Oscillospiraceae bacterium]